jgi:hypothetical protein
VRVVMVLFLVVCLCACARAEDPTEGLSDKAAVLRHLDTELFCISSVFPSHLYPSSLSIQCKLLNTMQISK